MRRPGIKPGSRPWQGRILSLYYRRRRAELSIPRLELGTSRVLGERHDQLDHTDLSVSGVSGFRSQYLDLAKVARFRLRQYPITGLWSIWVSIPVPRPCEGRTLPIAPIPRVLPPAPGRPTWFYVKNTFFAKKKLRHGESNPGHLRDRQRCYQLHHDGLVSLQRGSNSRPYAY